MKPIIFTLILLALVSCKDSKKSVSTDVENVYSNSWIKEIKLDNGNKWEANLETNDGILKMQNSIKTQLTTTLVEYHELARKLNDDKNYVIINCTMEGASHDNLHIWLLPLIAKIDALSEVKTIEDAAKIKLSIQKNINEYNTYFQ
jgi:hypothetical protein